MKNFNKTQSLEEAIETANEIERKLKECDSKSMTDEEALKEIADLANEIDLSWFKWYLRFDKYKINGENRWVIQQNTNLTNWKALNVVVVAGQYHTAWTWKKNNLE